MTAKTFEDIKSTISLLPDGKTVSIEIEDEIFFMQNIDIYSKIVSMITLEREWQEINYSDFMSEEEWFDKNLTT